MTILRDIRAAELAQQSHRNVQKTIAQANAEVAEKIEAERQKLNAERDGKVVLDLSRDPDPYGYHGISLVDRLRAMGWPE